MKKTIFSTVLVIVLVLTSTFTIMAKPNQDIPYLDPGITRSEFVVTLHDALDIHIAYLIAPDIKDYFNDVDPNASYASALIDLVTVGIVDDKGSCFRPNDILTREEMAHYIINAYKYKIDNSIVDENGYLTFRDANKVNPQYYSDCLLAVDFGFISGYFNNTLLPKYRATIENVNDVIQLFISREENNNAVKVEPNANITDDSIEMNLTIVNNTKKTVTINHNTSKQYDFTLLDANKNVLYRWSSDKMFCTVLTETEIPAGESVEFTAKLSGDQFAAIKDDIAYVNAYIAGSSTDFDINKEGYEYKVN